MLAFSLFIPNTAENRNRASAKCIEIAVPFRTWNSRALRAGQLILWGLIATSFLMTILSPLGVRLARHCSNRISEIQALLQRQSLREEQRNYLMGMAWTTTFRLLSMEAMISRGKGYIKDFFRHRE